MTPQHHRYTTPRRRAYADGMERGVRIGLAGLAVSYVLYLTGILPPHVPIERTVAHWHLPAPEFAARCGLYHGWSWIMAFREGDYLSLILIAFLASVTIWCIVRLMPFLVREKDAPMLVITLIQLAILVLAASGLVSGGH